VPFIHPHSSRILDLHVSPNVLLLILQIFVSTGIDEVDLSLDELNFCLEWDERSPVWVSNSVYMWCGACLCVFHTFLSTNVTHRINSRNVFCQRINLRLIIF